MIFDFPERFRYLRQSSLDTLSRIADVFGVSTDYLLGRTDSLGFDSLALNGEEKALVYKLAFALKNLHLRRLSKRGTVFVQAHRL